MWSLYIFYWSSLSFSLFLVICISDRLGVYPNSFFLSLRCLSHLSSICVFEFLIRCLSYSTSFTFTLSLSLCAYLSKRHSFYTVQTSNLLSLLFPLVYFSSLLSTLSYLWHWYYIDIIMIMLLWFSYSNDHDLSPF